MLGEISYLNVLSERTLPKLTLCKPNRTTIHPLKNIYGLKLIIRASALNEISFTIPTMVTKNHKLEINPLVDLLKDRYYAKVEFEGQTEYFLFLEKNKQLSNDGTTISYVAYGSGIELADKDLREYLEESKSLSDHAREMLSETIWSVDYVDAKFDLKYRTMDIAKSTVLQGLFDLAEKYNAFITFDSINRKVSFHQRDNIGINRGIKFKEGNLLDSLSVSTKSDEQVTRLTVYGQDGLEFRSLSPTGSNYIESFDYFIYPFECDENYNVLKHSDYMSDELCIALLKYKKKLLDNQGQFDSLVQQKKTKQNDIQLEEQTLSNLNIQLKQLEDEQWIINRTYQDVAPSRTDWQDVTNRLNAKKFEITNQQYVINTLNSQLNNIEAQINNLGITLKSENNFTEDELIELNKFILIGDHTNDSIIDEQDLWEEAKEVFETFNEPPIDATVGIEGYIDSVRDKLKPSQLSIGDISSVENEELRVNLKLRTTEITIDFDSDKVDLTIANGKDIVDVNSKWEKLLFDASNTSTTVNMEKYSYRKGKDAMDGVTQILNSEFDTAKNVLVGGYQNTTQINHRGLYSQDYEDENTYLVINNALMAITANNGNSVEVAISKRGVHAERVTGRLLVGNKLHIEDESGVITIEDAKLTVFDLDNSKRVELGRYVDPDDSTKFKYGLNIKSGAIDIRTSDNVNRGMQMDSNGLRAFNNNGVKTFEINSLYGDLFFMGNIESSIITASTIQSTSTANRGIKINNDGLSLYNSSGSRTVFLNANGNAEFQGTITSSSIIGGTIIGSSININNGVFRVESDGSATMTRATISTSSIDSKYITLAGSRIEGGDFSRGTSYVLGTANFAGLGRYRAGALQLDDYEGESSFGVSRRMQLATNSVMVQGSHLVLGGSGESRATIITRTVGIASHTTSVPAYISLHVQGGLNVTGSIYTGGSSVATVDYVQQYVAQAIASIPPPTPPPSS